MDIKKGLTEKEVKKRQEKGLINYDDPKSHMQD